MQTSKHIIETKKICDSKVWSITSHNNDITISSENKKVKIIDKETLKVKKDIAHYRNKVFSLEYFNGFLLAGSYMSLYIYNSNNGYKFHRKVFIDHDNILCIKNVNNNLIISCGMKIYYLNENYEKLELFKNNKNIYNFNVYNNQLLLNCQDRKLKILDKTDKELKFSKNINLNDDFNNFSIYHDMIIILNLENIFKVYNINDNFNVYILDINLISEPFSFAIINDLLVTGTVEGNLNFYNLLECIKSRNNNFTNLESRINFKILILQSKYNQLLEKFNNLDNKFNLKNLNSFNNKQIQLIKTVEYLIDKYEGLNLEYTNFEDNLKFLFSNNNILLQYINNKTSILDTEIKSLSLENNQLASNISKLRNQNFSQIKALEGLSYKVQILESEISNSEFSSDTFKSLDINSNSNNKENEENVSIKNFYSNLYSLNKDLKATLNAKNEIDNLNQSIISSDLYSLNKDLKTQLNAKNEIDNLNQSIISSDFEIINNVD